MFVFSTNTNYSFTVSFFCVILILSLVYSETKDFVYSGVKFHFTPDDELDSKMDLNVDMTVAMPCRCNNNNKFSPYMKISLLNCLFPRYWSRCSGHDGAERVIFWSARRRRYMVWTEPHSAEPLFCSSETQQYAEGEKPWHTAALYLYRGIEYTYRIFIIRTRSIIEPFH